MDALRNLIIIGAGGHGRDVLAIVHDINKDRPTFNVLGFVDDNKKGKDILGTCALLNKINSEYVIAINSSLVRTALDRTDLSAANIIHPSAIIGTNVRIDDGCVLGANTVLTTDVHLGRHVHVNVGATVNQGSTIGSYSTLAPGVHIAGDVKVGSNVTFGIGAMVINLITIGDNVYVGAGSVVIRDVPSDVRVVGVPAKPIRYG